MNLDDPSSVASDPNVGASTEIASARPFARALQTGDVQGSNTLQPKAFSALVATPPPAPTPPPPNPIETLLAIPGTIISTVLNLISQALAPLIGPGAPADNPALWAVLAFARRQFDQGFANSTPTLHPQQTSQDLDDNQVHGTFGGADADGDTLAYSVPTSGVGAPAHGTVAIDQASGTYTYTPDAGFTGEDYFYVTATDDAAGPHVHALGQSHAAVGTVTVTVAGPTVNVAPTITATPGATDPATGAIRYTVNTADANGDLVTVTVSAPSHGSIAVDPADQTAYTYTPDADYAHSLHLAGATAAGSDEFTFTATDVHGATGTVTVNPSIAAVNSAPTLAVVTEDTGAANGAVKVTMTYADADSDVLTLTVADTQHGGYFADAAGTTPIPTGASTSPGPVSPAGTTTTVYYVPDPARPGVETLSLTLTDAYGGSVAKSAQVTVVETENHAPTLSVTTSPTGAADGSVYVTVTLADADSDTVTLTVSEPQHGYYTYAVGAPPITDPINGPVATVPAGETQSLVYVPDPSRPGIETITVTATDASGATVSRSVEYNVVGTSNHAPTLSLTTSPTGAANGAVKVTITFADTDGDDLTLTVGGLQYGGYYADAAGTVPVTTGTAPIPGSVSQTGFTASNYYIPNPTANGVETLSFILTDPSGATVTKLAQISVGTPVGTVPGTVGEGDVTQILELFRNPADGHLYATVLRQTAPGGGTRVSVYDTVDNTLVRDGIDPNPLDANGNPVTVSVTGGATALVDDSVMDADGNVYHNLLLAAQDGTTTQYDVIVLHPDGGSSVAYHGGLGDVPASLSASPDGQHVYLEVVQTDQLTGIPTQKIVDLITGSTVVSTPANATIIDSFTGVTLFSATPVDAQGHLYYIDLSRTLQIAGSGPVALAERPLKLAASQDGQHVYALTAASQSVLNGVAILDVHLIDVKTGDSVDVGVLPLATASLSLLSDMAVSNDGARVLLVGDSGLTLVDTTTGTVTALPMSGASDAVFSADGSKAYVVTGTSIQVLTLPDTSVL